MNTKKLFISIITTLVFGTNLALAAGTPDDVQGLEAAAIDSSSIGLTWETTLDSGEQLVNNYRIYYGPSSVFDAGEGEYASELETPNNNTSFLMTR